MMISKDIKELVNSIAEEQSFDEPSDIQLKQIVDLYDRYTKIESFLDAIKDSKNVIIRSLSEQEFDKDYIIEYMKIFEVYIHVYYQIIPENILEERITNLPYSPYISDVISVIMEVMPSPSSIEYDSNISVFYDFLSSIRDTEEIIMFVKDPSGFMDKSENTTSKKAFLELFTN